MTKQRSWSFIPNINKRTTNTMITRSSKSETLRTLDGLLQEDCFSWALHNIFIYDTMCECNKQTKAMLRTNENTNIFSLTVKIPLL